VAKIKAWIVSLDILGDPHACIVDGRCTMANRKMVEVPPWEDAGCGDSTRLVDLTALDASKL
jgi:glyceraldehyde 3-phosphate dehydrogenase